jgi:hypothetical protein
MLHQLDLSGVCQTEGPDTCPIIWRSCAELRARVGPHGTKSSREIKTAGEELLNSHVIEQFALLDNSTNFLWQFGGYIWEQMRSRNTSNYVLVDLNKLGLNKSSFRIGVYLIVQKVCQSDAPTFTIPFDFEVSQAANIRRLLAALKAVSDVLDVVCFVSLEQRSDYPRPNHFAIKITHRSTLWKYHSYLKFGQSKFIWRVDAEGSLRLESSFVAKQRNDRIDTTTQGLNRQKFLPEVTKL